MAKKTNKNEGIEILEDPNALVDKANELFDNQRHRNLVFIISGIIAVLIIGLTGYNYYIKNQNDIAQEELFQSQFYFDADSLNLALNGDGNSYGFLEIIDEFPGTKASNIAYFYAGVCFLNSKDFEEAIRHLKQFDSDDYLLQGRAYSLIGDSYMEMDDFSNAINFYRKAVDYKKNKSFTPVYLKKLAIAHEQNGNMSDAANIYGTIVDDYPEALQIHEAKRQKARLEAMVQ